MSSTRMNNMPQELQEIKNLLTSHLDASKPVDEKKLTLVMGMDGLANAQFMNALTKRTPLETPALCARLAPLSQEKTHWLCECPSLSLSETLSHAAHVAGSYSVEVAAKRAATIGGVVLVIPSHQLTDGAGCEQFSSLLVRLSEMIEGDWVFASCLQVVVLDNNPNVAQDKLRQAYQSSLSKLAASVGGASDKKAFNLATVLDWLSATSKDVSIVSIHNELSIASVLKSIERLGIFSRSQINFKNYSEARCDFEEAMKDLMAQYTVLLDPKAQNAQALIDNKQSMEAMARFFTQLPVCAFNETQAFLSAWQARRHRENPSTLFHKPINLDVFQVQPKALMPRL